MRIAVRGQLTTVTLAEIFRRIIDRFEATGVDAFINVNLYMRALIDDEEVVIVNESGEIADTIEVSASNLENFGASSTKRSSGQAAMVCKVDIKRIELFRRFAASADVTRDAECKLLDVTDERLITIKAAWPRLELTPNERRRFGLLGRMIEAAQQLFPSWNHMIDWFQGPFPHSRLVGETPLEQVLEGGVDAVEQIAIALEEISARMRFGLGAIVPPPKNFDLINM